MASQEPVRLCIGCRTRDTTKNLVRVAFEPATDTRSVVVDERNVLPGRGAWLHCDPECFSTALRKRAFGRAFRSAVATELLEQQLEELGRTNTNTPNNDESGSEI